MAQNKQGKQDASFDERTDEQRGDILDGLDKRVDPASDNLEIGEADNFVNSEKTYPSERAPHQHAMVTNHTPHGLPADAHQALVSLAQQHRQEASAYEEVGALLEKYKTDDSDNIHPEVRAFLEEYHASLAPSAKRYEKTRHLLEKHV
jgi:hypothetical protein